MPEDVIPPRFHCTNDVLFFAAHAVLLPESLTTPRWSPQPRRWHSTPKRKALLPFLVGRTTGGAFSTPGILFLGHLLGELSREFLKFFQVLALLHYTHPRFLGEKQSQQLAERAHGTEVRLRFGILTAAHEEEAFWHKWLGALGELIGYEAQREQPR